MNLSLAKKRFYDLRAQKGIDVAEEHVISEHPERGYSIEEVVQLVKGRGILQDTNDPMFLGERFYWRTQDILGHKVRLVIEFEEDQDGELILVVSAGERV